MNVSKVMIQGWKGLGEGMGDIHGDHYGEANGTET